MLIASSYIIQFYPDYEYNETKVLLEVGNNNHTFTATSNKPTKQGWKDFENDSDDDSDDDNNNKDDNKTDLATLNSGESGLCALCGTTKEKLSLSLYIPCQRYWATLQAPLNISKILN